MANPPRSVKIDQDERGGWSSDRPRREGGPARPADIGVRCRVLKPADRMRYMPSSLVVVVSPSAKAREAFADRVFEDRDSSAVLSLARVRKLITGRVPDEDLEARASELLNAAVSKRLESGQPVVFIAEGLSPEEREPFLRLANSLRRPRHLILVEAPAADVAEEDAPVLNALRTALNSGDVGAEGFQTALRLGGSTVTDLKRIVFRAPPQDD